ncbi:hypothetical protein AKJ16_DCAP05007 [Drosera capensis]
MTSYPSIIFTPNKITTETIDRIIWDPFKSSTCMFVEISFCMGDGTNKIKIIPDYFEAPTTLPDSHQQGSSPILASEKSPH